MRRVSISAALAGTTLKAKAGSAPSARVTTEMASPIVSPSKRPQPRARMPCARPASASKATSRNR